MKWKLSSKCVFFPFKCLSKHIDLVKWSVIKYTKLQLRYKSTMSWEMFPGTLQSCDTIMRQI